MVFNLVDQALRGVVLVFKNK